MKRVESLINELHETREERDQLRGMVQALSSERDQAASRQMRSVEAHDGPPETGWVEAKRRKSELSAEIRAAGPTSRISALIEPMKGYLDTKFTDLVRHQIEAEHYWFQKIEVLPGLYSPGWSDPAKEKLPYYGLPADLTGKRVLDIGCAEGFFSFEAERRGAREVIGIDSFPESIRRFNIVKAARQSNASAFLMNVYDLEPKRLGTFDVVLFYGVFYHLKHPQYALERIRSICTGEMLFQTHMYEEPAVKGVPWARFYPHGMMSGSNNELFDPTIFWLFNSACCLAILDHVGFTDLKILSTDPNPFVVHAKTPETAPGVPPDQTEAPWC